MWKLDLILIFFTACKSLNSKNFLWCISFVMCMSYCRVIFRETRLAIYQISVVNNMNVCDFCFLILNHSGFSWILYIGFLVVWWAALTACVLLVSAWVPTTSALWWLGRRQWWSCFMINSRWYVTLKVCDILSTLFARNIYSYNTMWQIFLQLNV